MRIAALYDIHGNVPALQAVLKELDKIKPDLIIVGGDIVSGPMPVETLECLFKLGNRVQWISGNGDREVVMAYDGKKLPQTLSEKGKEVTRWVAGRLSQTQRDFLANLPKQLSFTVEDLGEVMFCHATPRSDEEIFTPKTSQERLQEIFSGIEQKIIVCGHTHIQFELQVGYHHVVNAGSVGMPFVDQPGAYWLLIRPEGYQFRHVGYNTEQAAQLIRKSGYPLAVEFAEKYIQNPPSKTAMIDMLERMAIEQ